MIDVVALDGDDTLWHSENQFVMTQDRFTDLLADNATLWRGMKRKLAAHGRNAGAIAAARHVLGRVAGPH